MKQKFVRNLFKTNKTSNIMQKGTKNMIIIAIMLIIIKSILVLLVSTPTTYTDEFIYIKIAQNFFQEQNFAIHNIPTSNYLPLYPIILSLAFLTENVPQAYLLMKIINAILSTLIIIPAYLISKEFLDTKKSTIAATIIGLMPMNFVFPAFIMAENLFYLLFLVSIYFIYKSFTEKNSKYDILAGIFIGLTFLTKFAGISLIGIVIIISLYKLSKKELFEIKKKLLMGSLSLAIVSPWLIRNVLNFGFSLEGVLGQYSSDITKQVGGYPLNMFYWIVLYSGYLLLASFVVVAILAFSNMKEKFKEEKIKIFTLLAIVTLFIIIIGAAQHAAKSGPKEETNLPGLIGRPIGRYIDTALPVLYLIGIITYFKYKENKKMTKKIFLISIPIIVISLQILYFKLVPANNITLTLIGAINLGLTKISSQKISITILTLLILFKLTLIYHYIKNSKIKKIKLLTKITLLLMLTSLVAYGGVIYNSNINWENNPQIELSRWMSKNIDKNSKILVDEEYCGVFEKNRHEILCTPGKSTALSSLWILNPVEINSIKNEADYIITMKKLDLKLIKETPNRIKLYQKK